MTSRVLELARECGLHVTAHIGTPGSLTHTVIWQCNSDQLEAFAALIAQEAKAEGAAEQRAKDAEICIAQKTGYQGDWDDAIDRCADAIAAQAGGKGEEGG